MKMASKFAVIPDGKNLGVEWSYVFSLLLGDECEMVQLPSDSAYLRRVVRYEI